MSEFVENQLQPGNELSTQNIKVPADLRGGGFGPRPSQRSE